MTCAKFSFVSKFIVYCLSICMLCAQAYTVRADDAFSMEELKEAIGDGFDVNQPFKVFGHDTTLLILFAFSGKVDAIELLINNGADIHIRDSSGRTALMLACQEGYVGAVELLLNKGADIHGRDDEGRTPLLIACEQGHIAVLQTLLDNGADVHVKDYEDRTALMFIEELREADIIEEKSVEDIIALLKSYGVKQ